MRLLSVLMTIAVVVVFCFMLWCILPCQPIFEARKREAGKRARRKLSGKTNESGPRVDDVVQTDKKQCNDDTDSVNSDDLVITWIEPNYPRKSQDSRYHDIFLKIYMNNSHILFQRYDYRFASFSNVNRVYFPTRMCLRYFLLIGHNTSCSLLIIFMFIVVPVIRPH